MSLDNINIVLVRPFHPGNIGAAARSMKTMGLSKLILVAPKRYPDPDANKMAAGGLDVLEQASIYQTIDEALANCTAVIATSARPRGFELPTFEPEQAARYLVEHAQQAKVALMFGPERMGLHNEDLKLAQHRVSIPANPEYQSLNLAAAVQTLSYEVFKARRSMNKPDKSQLPLPSVDELSRFYLHLENVLRSVSFLRSHEGDTLKRVHSIFNRAISSQADVKLLRGVLTSIQKTLAGEKRSTKN